MKLTYLVSFAGISPESAAPSYLGDLIYSAVESGFRIKTLLRTWRWRSQSRRRLAQLPDRMLRDVGIDRDEAEQEIAKPFWVS
jgi:uncharacterized protein YjiS (DUF1127 family)